MRFPWYAFFLCILMGLRCTQLALAQPLWVSDRSGGVSVPHPSQSGTPRSNHFSAAAWRKIRSCWQVWKEAWVKLPFLKTTLAFRAVYLNRVQFKFTFFKGTLWFFQLHSRSLWLFSLQNSTVCWEQLSYFNTNLLDIFITL